MPPPVEKKTVYLEAPSENEAALVVRAADATPVSPLIVIEDRISGVRSDAVGGARSLGGRTVFVGDSATRAASLENGISGANTTSLKDNWPTYAELLSGGKIWHARNLAVSGQTSGDQLASFPVNAGGYGGATCFIAVGINDVGTGVSFATYKSNILGLIAAAVAFGMTPILCTIPPNNIGGRHAAIILWNTWLKRLAGQMRIPLIDFYSVLVDTTNGNYLAAMDNGDGTHPSIVGHAALGQAVATALASMLPTVGAPLVLDNVDPNNLLGGGLFLGALTAGIAAPWAPYGSLPGGCTASVITDGQVPGKMQQMVCAATAGNSNIYQNIAVGGTRFSIGDRLAFSGVVTSDGGVTARVALLLNGSITVDPVWITRAVTRGRYYCEITVPPGTTSIDHLIQAGVGSGAVSFGQVTAYNLTTGGIL